MRKWTICLACVLAMMLAGCVPGDLPAGDRDEIGASEGVVPEPSEANVPLAELAGLEPDGLPCFVSTGVGFGPDETGGQAASAVELDGGLMAGPDGVRWVDCDKLNAAAGFAFIRTDGGPRVRHAASDPDIFGVFNGNTYVSLDGLSAYCDIRGADEAPELGVEPGGAVSEKDRPVLDSVLGAIQENLESRGVVLDLSMGARYAYGDGVYVRSDSEAIEVGYMDHVSDGVAYDGRRVWLTGDGSLMIGTDDGKVVEYVTEASGEEPGGWDGDQAESLTNEGKLTE